MPFEVYKELGYGFQERIYQRAMQVEWQRAGLAAEIERRIQVRYKGAIVGDYDADLLVDSSVIVEIKVSRNYNSDDEPQLLNELKALGSRLDCSSTSVERVWSSKGWFSEPRIEHG